MAVRRPWTTRLLLLAGACAAPAACDSPTGPGEPDSVTLAAPAQPLRVGDTVRIEATVRDSRGREVTDVAVAWSSTDPGVAAVTQAGVVQGRRSGTATILAVVGADTGRAQVSVIPVEWRQVQASYRMTCGLTTSGSVYCWTSGAVGDPPRLLRGRFTATTVGVYETCGLTEGGEVRCVHPLFQADTLFRVPGGLRFTRISGGIFSGCGITAESRTYCWRGELPESRVVVHAPEPLAPDPGLVAVSSSGDRRACGLTAAGVAYCWEDRTTGIPGSPPAPVPTALRFDRISVGYTQACGLTAAGEAYCWGSNRGYELGVPREARTGCTLSGSGVQLQHSCTVPQRAGGTLRFRSIDAGMFHTCGLAVDGKAYCWGTNWNKALGVASVSTDICQAATPNLDCTPDPVPVSGGVVFATLGPNHGTHHCGLTAAREAFCWGGATGFGPDAGSPTPFRLPDPVPPPLPGS